MKSFRTLLLGLVITSTTIFSLSAQGVSEPITKFPINVNKAKKATITTNATKDISQYLRSNLEYPKQLEELGIETEALIKVTINKEGDIVATEMVKSIGAEFDQRIISSLNQLGTVSPIYVNGKAKEYSILVPLQYKLNR